jgi:hypothetical protein
VANLCNSTDQANKGKHNKESAERKARLFFFDERIDTTFNTTPAHIPFDGNAGVASSRDVVRAIQKLSDKLPGSF